MSGGEVAPGAEGAALSEGGRTAGRRMVRLAHHERRGGGTSLRSGAALSEGVGAPRAKTDGSD